MKKKVLFALPIVFVGAVTVFALSGAYDAPARVSQAIFGSEAMGCSASTSAAQVSSGCSVEQQAAMTAAVDSCCAEKGAVQTAALASEEPATCSTGAALQTAAYAEGSAAEFAVTAAEGDCPMAGCSAETKQVAAKDCGDCPTAKEDCATCPMSGKAAVQTADAGESAQVVAAQE